MSSPVPKSPEHSDKSRKYDRQLRLWGDHGQIALESAHVCLINATGIGTETLKSLVLPGIGAFTIVDGRKISGESIGCNFFLDIESIGKSQAQIATQLLLELNPDVRGDYVEEDVEQLLENNPDFFNNFTIVIGTALTERAVILVSKKLWELDIPFITCRSYGMIGCARVQTKEHTVIETHPENQIPDLRLDNPFPELKRFLDSFDLESMEFREHAHVPYLIVLYKYLEKWKAAEGKPLPTIYKEKQSLKEMIEKGKFVEDDGRQLEEENFEEAMKAVNYALAPSKISADVRSILDDDCCINLTSKSKPFWIMTKAVRDFVENEGNGLLPLRGSIPDMTSNTDMYISLQKIYHEQASKEAEVVYRRVQQLLHQLNQPADSITEHQVKLFCKHSSGLYIVRGSPLFAEYEAKSSPTHNLGINLENPDSSVINYVMLRGVEKFYSEYNTYPGEFDDQVEPDIVKLKAFISKLITEWGCGSLSKDDYVHEICRYGGAELHTVSAYMGGCIAQETIKFITGQYKPFNNTFIHDAITCSCSTFVI